MITSNMSHSELILEELAEKTDISSKDNKKNKSGLLENKEKWDTLSKKKDEMKNTVHRRRYDEILRQVDAELVDTVNQNVSHNGEFSNRYKINYYTLPSGDVDYIPTLSHATSTATTSIPMTKKPHVFSKVQIAVSLLGSKIPDANFESDEKIWARANYELWKRTWEMEGGNAMPAWQSFVQNTATTGFGAIKTFYKEVRQPVKSGAFETERVLFDDVYRLALDPSRVWVGVGYKNSDYWSKTEYLYEEDLPVEEIITRLEMMGVKKVNKKKLDLCQLSEEGKREYSEKEQTHGTVTYYENELTNTYLIMCGQYVLFEGELDSPDGYASISTANFFVRNERDPYGVGLWELGRGSSAMMNHLDVMTAQQIESELSPILFQLGAGAQGTKTYQRGSNIINQLTAGSEIEVVRTTGNPSAAMGYIQNEKQSLDETTGLPEVLSGLGSETTLGATVIVKEAALQRLSIPRNSVINALKRDAFITCSYFKTHYALPKVQSFATTGALDTFIENNPTYFVEEIPELSEEGGEVFATFAKKITMPFYLGINSEAETEDDKVEYDENSPSTYVRTELMKRVEVIRGFNPLSSTLTITVDPNSLLQPSEELTQQKISSLAPSISQMTLQALQAAQQDPMLGKALMKQLVAYLEAMKLDVYTWLPKEIADQAMKGELVQPGLQQLAAANQMAEAGQKMQDVGMPITQDVNNLPQVGNQMQDAYNASVGKLDSTMASSQPQ